MGAIKFKKKHIFIIFLILVSCFISELATLNNLLTPLENLYYDLWHQVAKKRFKPEHVVIVAIDDKSFAAHENQPLAFWGPNYAKAISVFRKKGAKIVGIDMHFAVSAESWLKEIDLAESNISRTFDIPFRKQLNSGVVILIGTYLPLKSGDPFIWPVNDYLFSLKGAWNDIGLSNLYTDDDEVIRSYVIKIVNDPRFHGMTFGPLLAKRAENILFPSSLSTPRPIGFAGPPGTFPRISFQSLLEKGALKNPRLSQVKGKVIIIAQENSFQRQDIHLTPYTRRFANAKGSVMSGPEIHANIIETLITGKYPEKVPKWFRILSLLVIHQSLVDSCS